ncbi:MAG: universal stress protein [Bacteroidales bacterium]|nr:universal stress protein [Bacteroidales bacterium]MCF8387495.1 universal stress protein [Bacteroidales bacterium]MCF8398436.1 universal stress protein [Bacteroidales bacterium]
MSSILIPVDFSATSKNNIQYGLNLARETGRNIELLYVVQIDYPSYGQIGPIEPLSNPAGTGTISPINIKEQEETAKNEFDKLLLEIKSNIPEDVNIETNIRTGIYPDVVIEESSRKKIEIILLNSRGKEEKLQGMAIESIDAILESAPCPTIIISPQTRFENIKKILYATDFQKEDIESLKELSGFAGRFKADILALHITENPDFRERIEKKGFNELVSEKVGYPHISVMSMPSDKIAKGIANYAYNTSVDMIALLKENKGFWKSLFSKSTTERLMKETDLPIIVFNQANKG